MDIRELLVSITVTCPSDDSAVIESVRNEFRRSCRCDCEDCTSVREKLDGKSIEFTLPEARLVCYHLIHAKSDSALAYAQSLCWNMGVAIDNADLPLKISQDLEQLQAQARDDLENARALFWIHRRLDQISATTFRLSAIQLPQLEKPLLFDQDFEQVINQTADQILNHFNVARKG